VAGRRVHARAPSRPISSPARVTLNAHALDRVGIVDRFLGSPTRRQRAAPTARRRTRQPTLITHRLATPVAMAPATKRVVVGMLAKVAQLARHAACAAVRSARPDDAPHDKQASAVDTGARGRHVDRRADPRVLASARDGIEQARSPAVIAFRQRPEAADVVDAELAGGRSSHDRRLDDARRARSLGDQRHRRHADALL